MVFLDFFSEEFTPASDLQYIRPVWSESSLCAQWVAKDPSFLRADSEDSDQTGRMYCKSIRPVWSESSLCAQWVAKDPSFLRADSEDSDQTGRMYCKSDALHTNKRRRPVPAAYHEIPHDTQDSTPYFKNITELNFAEYLYIIFQMHRCPLMMHKMT